jgi:hypothetical protein
MHEMDPRELEAMMSAVERFNTALVEAKAFVTAGGLHPPSTAITVDATAATTTHTLGPFVDAKQYVGGFWIVEVADEAVAIAWAEQCSAAVQSRIEVRALQEAPE